MFAQILNVFLLILPPMVFAVYGSMKENDRPRVVAEQVDSTPKRIDRLVFAAKFDAKVEPNLNSKNTPCDIRHGERILIRKHHLLEKSDTSSYHFKGAVTVERLDGAFVRCSLTEGSFSKDDFVRL